MKTLAKMLVLVSVAAVSLGGEAHAETECLVPPHNGPVPRFGFDSYYSGHGEHVCHVRHGGRAWRMGLEPGDVIVAVNGQRLRYDGHWYHLIRRAAFQGHATLAIRNWRNGRICYRTTNLGGGPPVTPKSRHNSRHNSHHRPGRHHGHSPEAQIVGGILGIIDAAVNQ